MLATQDSIYIEEVDDLLTEIDVLLNEVTYEVFPPGFVSTLDTLSSRLVLEGSRTSSIIRDNLAILMVNSSPQNGFRGLRIVSTGSNTFSDESFEYITVKDPSHLTPDASDAVVYLPERFLDVTGRISFVVLRDDRNYGQFNLQDDRPFITSRIVSVNLPGEQSDDDLTSFYFKDIVHTDGMYADEVKCVSWVQVLASLPGIWTQTFCESIRPTEAGMLHRCDCSITPHTAIYLDLSSVTTTTEATTMETTEDLTITDTIDLTTTTDVTPELTEIELRILLIIEEIKELLGKGDSIYIIDVDDILDEINDLLGIEEDVVFPGELLTLLDDLGTRIHLNGTLTDMIVKDNIAFLAADVGHFNPVIGLRVATREVEAFMTEAFEFLVDVNISHLLAKRTEAVVDLPRSVLDSPRRISFVVFLTNRAFQYEGANVINSRVISINVVNLTQFDNEVVKLHFRPMEEPERETKRSCGYWQFQPDGSGYWSQEGCIFVSSTSSFLLDTCLCDHLTHFAEILIPRPRFSESDERILELLSIIGCGLSIFGVTLIATTAFLFNTWRSVFRNRMWLQLCVALLILSLCFLLVAFVKYDQYSFSCLVTGVVLHYSLLASFCWMLVVAIIAYFDMVAVQYTIANFSSIPNKLLITSGFSWAAPAVVIAILLLISPKSYVRRFEEMAPSGSFCYPSGLALWLSVYAPIAIILVVNFLVFIYTIGHVTWSMRNRNLGKQKMDSMQEAIRCARIGLVLMFLFGLPWIFGLFAYKVICAYVFTVTVTTQGFLLFLFIVCGNNDTRNMWYNKIKFTTKYRRRYSQRTMQSENPY
ncbi:adhesion G-protein coupled receptor G2-like isoform X2 [Galleria mellonella]|nr:adhesion G-protein coupled receptor G2-like isoform X2 [Galleria mellonella]XP_052759166.1 adhesion G-protein coupled receptor G2-like isoform X2 [Galleria mellonella]